MNTHVLRRVPVLEVQTKYKLFIYFYIYGPLFCRANAEVCGPLPSGFVAHSWAVAAVLQPCINP